MKTPLMKKKTRIKKILKPKLKVEIMVVVIMMRKKKQMLLILMLMMIQQKILVIMVLVHLMMLTVLTVVLPVLPKLNVSIRVVATSQLIFQENHGVTSLVQEKKLIHVLVLKIQKRWHVKLPLKMLVQPKRDAVGRKVMMTPFPLVSTIVPVFLIQTIIQMPKLPFVSLNQKPGIVFAYGLGMVLTTYMEAQTGQVNQ
eukprot:jgi/Orpsp1_1/1189620/evm.model.d7180000073274.1